MLMCDATLYVLLYLCGLTVYGLMHGQLYSVAWQPNFDKQISISSHKKGGGIRGGGGGGGGGAMVLDGNRITN